MSTVYAIWDESDYYGPEICHPLHATRELAEAAKNHLNTPYRQQCAAAGSDPARVSQDYPHYVKEHEVVDVVESGQQDGSS